MRLYIGMLIFVFASLTASANPVSITGFGNGQGWNDGSDFTGYVTATFDGVAYPGLCIDALHESVGTSWDAVYVPLTDAADVTAVMSAYFGISDPAVYLPKLFRDMTGYAMLSGIDTDEALNNQIQDAVWAQFDGGKYSDNGVLSAYAAQHSQIDITQFGLIVDAHYPTGGKLEQAFLVDPRPTPLQQFFVVDPELSPAPEPASIFMIGGSLIVLSALLRRHKARTGHLSNS